MPPSNRIELSETALRPNQKTDLEFEAGWCKFSVQQTHSTPGIRLVEPLVLDEGEYEFVVTAQASTNDTFFLWAFDIFNKASVGGTVHVSTTKEQIVTQFSVTDRCEVDIGILSHKQNIGDSCKLYSIEIRPTKSEEFSQKPFYLEPNQKAILEDCGDYWEVLANQNKSTPGCKLSLAVSPNSLHAIEVDVDVSSETANAFLWAYSRTTGEELLPRVHLFQGGTNAQRTKKTVYLMTPENEKEILVGVLFSSAGLKSADKLRVYSLTIERITTLSDVVDAGYVLNLDGEEEKFNYCHHVLAREGFEVDRMPAVRGAAEPHVKLYDEYKKSPLNDEDQRLGRKSIQSAGAWGYLLTMEKILHDAIDKNHERIVVFDDDIILTHDFTLKFSRLIHSLDNDWKIVALGASQWDWTGIDISSSLSYSPNNLSNGSFAIIYDSSIFEELLSRIQEMDSPFDSKPLKSIYENPEHNCYVAYPNLVVADVEKVGIRDSRKQSTYASRFRWKMDNFPTNYKRWRSLPILLHESTPKLWPKDNCYHFVMAVTTINRWDYLQNFLSSWLATRNNKHNWTLIVADDGSNDETLRELIEFEMGDTKVVIIQNSGGGIAKQTNSVFNYCMENTHSFDLLFSSDDDIFFIQPGWDDAYHNAVVKTGFDHLVHFNENWKESRFQTSVRKNGISLTSKTNVDHCMGCFYTVTPRMLEDIGGFDEKEFPIRGHSHIDFSMRACRKGYNNAETLFDIESSTDYIGIHPKEGYVTTLRRYSYKEQMTLSDPSEKRRRWDLIHQNGRIYVDLPVGGFFQPESVHLGFTEFENTQKTELEVTTEERKEIAHPVSEESRDLESKYNHHENWSYSDNILKFNYKGLTLWWKMPENYSFEDSHPDLFKLAEFVLLYPLEPNILDGWKPTRKPGFRPGLAFSGGIDSTAAMELLPEQTVLFYHKREGFNSKLDHSNAIRFIDQLNKCHNKRVIVVESNHEVIRTLSENKSPGFMTDYACAVHVILLADLFSLDSLATGMPLENSYLWHGQKFRQFNESWFWKKHAPLFESVGLPILQPVMGCSEIINQKIVKKAGYIDFAQSCLRSSSELPCGSCWKCFRKNSLNGSDIILSNEIDTFLSKPKLKMAASTLYTIQQLRGKTPLFDKIVETYPTVSRHIDEDVSFLEQHYSPSLDLIPEKYRNYVRQKIELYVEKGSDFNSIEGFNLYPENSTT